MTSAALEIVEEIRAAKQRFFDRYLDGHILDVDADISDVFVPTKEWARGYVAEPVRFSVATRKDSPLEGRFFATVEFDLSKRSPNVGVTGMLVFPDGTCRSIVLPASSKIGSWEIGVIDARWNVQLSIDGALEMLGIRRRFERPEKPQRELPLFRLLRGGAMR